MPELVIVYWRDIPSQVVVKSGRRQQVKRLLPDRFQVAIDAAAMRGDARDADSYLEDWRRGPPETVTDDPEAVLEATVAAIEAEWDREKLRAAVLAGGRLASENADGTTSTA